MAVLRQLAPHLAIIHAQNESILSFDGPARLELLDGFARKPIGNVAQSYAAWKRFEAALTNWSGANKTACGWSIVDFPETRN